MWYVWAHCYDFFSFLVWLLLHVCVKWDPTCLENYAFGHLPGGGWVGCAGPWGVDATLRILIFNITSYPNTISSSQLCIICGIFLSSIYLKSHQAVSFVKVPRFLQWWMQLLEKENENKLFICCLAVDYPPTHQSTFLSFFSKSLKEDATAPAFPQTCLIFTSPAPRHGWSSE